MSYPHTDVLCCFPGIGRTTFSAEQNKGGSTFCLDLDYDGKNINSFIETLKAELNAKNHRYILIPIGIEIFPALNQNGIEYFVVAPWPEDLYAWAKAWMKKGATVKMMRDRYTSWSLLLKLVDTEPYIIYLQNGDWLGNILEQTPASAEDGKDVRTMCEIETVKQSDVDCPLCGEPLVIRSTVFGDGISDFHTAYCHCGFSFSDDCPHEEFMSKIRKRAANWTPCAERLPERGQEVLFQVKCDMTGGDLYGMYKGEYRDGTFWIDEYDHKSHIGALLDTVLAWMPAPETYRGEA